ncbi:DUF72 domain-containing protein [Phenylobacterium soli]|uniref:DUF72 domain-containing protein n=1 Tax=Phenylobacterium soli TaxID=2170551 RepID=A0A328ALM2_9CAUL|nr:DUF72 domain-containing protein [Phenylobacterium soli]RAK53758.1 DUF72 domain-containing protein [Phenylobacterium soli]
MTELRIGCSGWTYKDWTGPFYPEGTKDRDRLAHYASVFDTAEINASFYRLPSEAMVEGWARRAPAGFTFAWKVSRFITHNKKLNDCAEPVALVFGRMAPLGDHYGPALIQLPPQLRRNDERLAGFLQLLPKGRRHTVEFRHDSWYAPEVFRILADFDAALCISDHHSAPSPWEVTASWVYVRGHGPGGRYHGRYPDAELAAWAARIAGWRAEGRDVYAYFDNDVKSAAPFDAQRLQTLTGAAPYGSAKPPE